MKAKFFSTQQKFRKWLKSNHENKEKLWVGYYKVATGLPSMTWSESVDQALCYGWIDGLRKSIDEKSYMIRFTPRRPNSTWSATNIKKVDELTEKGLMRPAGIKAAKNRSSKKSKLYSFEQKNVKLGKNYEKKIRDNDKAWQFFSSLTPSAKKMSTWWVMSAKKEETRFRRLEILIKHSAKGEKLPQIDWKKK